jgi:hypothetical protein
MGFWIALIPVACCAAVPVVIAVASFMSSSKRKKLQDNPVRRDGAQQSLPGEPGRN